MKKMVLTVISLIFGTALIFGADFWSKKKYTDWSKKEVQQMLKNSPWAQSVDLRTGGGGGRGGGGGGGRRGGGGGGSMGDASGGQGSGGGSAQGSVEMAPTVRVTVRWDSAMPVKQAIIKSNFDASGGLVPSGTGLLERQETQYIVSISDLPLRMMRGDPSRIKAAAQLNIKGKEPIKAEGLKSYADGANTVFYIMFPRTTPLVLEDQEVEVLFKAGPVDIKRKFKLKDMVFEGKLEL